MYRCISWAAFKADLWLERSPLAICRMLCCMHFCFVFVVRRVRWKTTQNAAVCFPSALWRCSTTDRSHKRSMLGLKRGQKATTTNQPTNKKRPLQFWDAGKASAGHSRGRRLPALISCHSCQNAHRGDCQANPWTVCVLRCLFVAQCV